MRVRKAVIPVAGFGTRFLPATRSVAKVLIPVFDTPAIHFSVEEAVSAGIEHIVLVISHGQEAVGQYFGGTAELEAALERAGRTDALKRMLEISEMAEISYAYQKRPLGLGHAVLTARAAVGNEPFAVFLRSELGCSSEGDSQGRVAPGRTVPQSRIHSHQPELSDEGHSQLL